MFGLSVVVVGVYSRFVYVRHTPIHLLFVFNRGARDETVSLRGKGTTVYRLLRFTSNDSFHVLYG